MPVLLAFFTERVNFISNTNKILPRNMRLAEKGKPLGVKKYALGPKRYTVYAYGRKRHTPSADHG